MVFTLLSCSLLRVGFDLRLSRRIAGDTFDCIHTKCSKNCLLWKIGILVGSSTIFNSYVAI